MIKETGFVKNYEAKFRIKNGSVRIGSMSAAIIELNGEPHIISITRDITEQKLSDQNLKESEEKFRKAFLTSPDPIAINKFPTGEYVLVNQGFTDVTGYTTEEVIGKNYFDINSTFPRPCIHRICLSLTRIILYSLLKSFLF